MYVCMYVYRTQGGINLAGDLVDNPGPGAYDPPSSIFAPFFAGL